MSALARDGEYTIDSDMLAKLQSEFAAGCADDARTFDTIRDTFERTGYLLDTHTAVGVTVYNDYVSETGSETPAVIASTASPFKFAGSVLTALGKKQPGREYDDFELLAELEKISGRKAPAALSGLRSKPERFTDVIAADEMKSAVSNWLGR